MFTTVSNDELILVNGGSRTTAGDVVQVVGYVVIGASGAVNIVAGVKMGCSSTVKNGFGKVGSALLGIANIFIR